MADVVGVLVIIVLPLPADGVLVGLLEQSEVLSAPICVGRSAVVVVQCDPRMSGSAFRRPMRPVL